MITGEHNLIISD